MSENATTIYSPSTCCHSIHMLIRFPSLIFPKHKGKIHTKRERRECHASLASTNAILLPSINMTEVIKTETSLVGMPRSRRRRNEIRTR